MKKVGIVYDNIYAQHDTNLFTTHPECKERVLLTIESLKENQMYGEDADDHYIPITPRLADLDQIRWVHTNELINQVKATVDKAKGGMPYTFMDGDTPVSAESYNAALSAAGGNFEAIDQTLLGNIDRAFVLCRPPGHHANRGLSRGFCLFNNVILAVNYLFRKKNIDRIAIYDFDVHAGNGSEDLIWKGVPGLDDKEILFISSHQDPSFFYPGECFADDIGEGKQKGKIINIPFKSGSGDDSVKQVMKNIINPIMNEFKPQFVLISAGFDAHYADPIGSLGFTKQGYWEIIESLKLIADEHSSGRMVATLEGGYNLEAVAKSITNVIRSMAGDKTIDEDDFSEADKNVEFTKNEIIPAVIENIEPYWKCLK